jgi:hypothetical protein
VALVKIKAKTSKREGFIGGNEFSYSSLFFQSQVLSHGNKGPGHVAKRVTKNMHQFGKGQVGKEEQRNDDVQFIDEWSACNHRCVRL